MTSRLATLYSEINEVSIISCFKNTVYVSLIFISKRNLKKTCLQSNIQSTIVHELFSKINIMKYSQIDIPVVELTGQAV